jgi:riboflavin kinase/FMN adenylyltransferase
MRIVTSPSELDHAVPVVATIGAFDGVHIGHRALVERVVMAARERAALAMVITFRPHPVRLLRPASAPALITRYEDRAERLASLGVDVLLELAFDRAFAALSAGDFVDQVLVRAGVVHVVAGPDLRFGSDRSGDLDALRTLGADRGLTAECAEPVWVDGQLASSTRVRRLVMSGEVASAARVLGVPHRVVGRVVHGDKRGRTIGTPTANLACHTELLPDPGVYATWANVDGRRYASVTNLGWRPTVEGNDLRFETHLLDFNGDLYEQLISVDLVERLRSEERFSGVEALMAQIKQDVAMARERLSP